jgi:hypothetical protein
MLKRRCTALLLRGHAVRNLAILGLLALLVQSTNTDAKRTRSGGRGARLLYWYSLLALLVQSTNTDAKRGRAVGAVGPAQGNKCAAGECGCVCDIILGAPPAAASDTGVTPL